MSRVTQFLVAAVFLLSTSAAFAEDIKVGYVDMQRALNETEDGRKAKAKLKKDFDQKQKELDEQQAELKKEIEDLDKKRTLLPADKVREKEAELQRAAGEGAADLHAPPAGPVRARSRRRPQKIFERMTKIIAEIAAAENFSMIVDKVGAGVRQAAPGPDQRADPPLQRGRRRRRGHGAGGAGGQAAAPKK